MKRVIISAVALFSFIFSSAQNETEQPPYKKNPAYPAIKLLLTDSVSYYTKEDLPKKKPVILMMFNPTCEHCQHETEDILKDIDKLKDIQIVMASSMSLDAIRLFIEKNKLADFKNIIVGQDTHFFLPGFFMVRNLPFMAFYDGKKNLIDVHSGPTPVESILEKFKGH
jgi:thioredoxin-related protein